MIESLAAVVKDIKNLQHEINCTTILTKARSAGQDDSDVTPSHNCTRMYYIKISNSEIHIFQKLAFSQGQVTFVLIFSSL